MSSEEETVYSEGLPVATPTVTLISVSFLALALHSIIPGG